MNQKDFIQKFRRDDYGIGSDGTLNQANSWLFRNLTSAIEHLSKGLYEKDIHFLLELIQNAEDNDYPDGASPDLAFSLLEEDPTNTPGCSGCLCVINNETGFSKENIRSVSAIGASTKTKKQGYIGEKGIGFKSVFIVSPSPHIFSNGFQIAFRENDPELELSYIVPYWVEHAPKIARKHSRSTVLLLPLKHEKRGAIKKELSKVKPESILFLSKIESLEIDIPEETESIRLIRDADRFPKVDLLVEKNGSDDSLDHYWVHKKVILVPPDLVEEKRDGITDREITLAFPLSENAAAGTIFAYLPTEVHSSFPFLVNADFILTANRESIQPSRPWNIWIRDQIASVVVEALTALAAQEDTRDRVCAFVPLPNQKGALAEFFDPVSAHAIESLQNQRIILTDQDETVQPSEARTVKREIRGLFPTADRPNTFDELHFVAAGVSKYHEQLKALGVKQLSPSEFNNLLSDDEWVTSRPIHWFINLYMHLSKSRNSPKSLPNGYIVPLRDGNFSTKNDQNYFLFDQHLLADLDTILQAGLAPVNIVHKQIHDLANGDPMLRSWLGDTLGIRVFSVSEYVQSSLLPWLIENQGAYGIAELLESSRMLMRFWEDLSSECRSVVRNHLPCLLEDNAIHLRDSIKDRQLLTPRSFNANDGWQLFMQDKESTSYAILADDYQKLAKESESYAQFLFGIGATDVPTPLVETFSSSDSWNHRLPIPLKAYVTDAVSTASSGRDLRISTALPPAFLSETPRAKTETSRRAMLRWLEALVKHDSKRRKALQATRTWKYYGPKMDTLPSYFSRVLREVAWVRSSKGYKRPGEVFLPLPSTRNLFKDRLPYLQDEISDELTEILGIKKDVTENTVIEYLQDLAADPSPDIQLVTALYKYLGDYGQPEHIQSAFHKENLIYVPNSEKGWHQAQDVIWEDASTALGDLFPCLSPTYESAKLRDFFVKSVGVAESADSEAYANAWLRLPEHSIEPERVEASLGIIYPKIRDIANAEGERPDWWEHFIENVQAWTQSDTFDLPQNVFARDNESIAAIFKDDVDFVWKPAGITHVALEQFYSDVGIRPITEAVSTRALNHGTLLTTDEPTYLTKDAKLLLARMLFNTDQDKFEENLKSGFLAHFFGLTEHSTSQLDLVYAIEDFGIERVREDQSAYLDADKGQLIISTQSDEIDTKEAVAEALARLLWGNRDFRAHADTVEKCLGVNSDRARKIRKNKGWSLAKDVEARLHGFLSTDASHAGTPGQPIGTPAPETPREDGKDQRGGKTESGADSGYPADSGSSPLDAPNKRVSGGSHEGKEPTDDQSGQTTPQPGGSRDRTGRSILHVTRDRNTTGSPATKPTTQGRRAGTGLGDGRGANTLPSDAGGAEGRSRSASISKHIQGKQQHQIPVYVAHETREDAEEREKRESHNKSIGDAAEAFVIEVESRNGWKITPMNQLRENNPGYDLQLMNPDTGEVRFAEVKGVVGPWGERGVGLTSRQYLFARDKKKAFWLYVVENLRSASPKLHRINDPAGLITQYRFNGSWAVLADTGETQVGEKSLEDLVEELKSLTDPRGADIIDFCFREGLALPEVGYEISSEMDEVIAELELAWPDAKLGILQDAVSLEALEGQIPGWSLFDLDRVTSDHGLLRGLPGSDSSL